MAKSNARPATAAAIAALVFLSMPFAALGAQKGAAADEASTGFRLEYESPKNPDYRELESALQESAVFEAVLEDLNSFLVLPHDIPVVFAECGEANAFYSPEHGNITLCYELMEDFARVFAENGGKPEEVAQQLIEATAFIFYHEMGHALVHQLELPITGKEEDAVDDLATVILINADDDKDGEKMAFSAAEAFYLWGEEVGDAPGEEAYADEHSLDKQRFYNILCTVYGSDEEAFSDIVGEEGLPEARAQRCADEYHQKSTSWSRLLGSHLKS